MGTVSGANKLSKKAKLLLMTLVGSVIGVFSLLAVLLYINFYVRVNVVLTTITRYEDGDIKNVSEYDIIRIKKGRNISYLPSPAVEGYSFGGWYFDESCQAAFDYTLELQDNVQLYGKLDLMEYNIELVLEDDIIIESNISRDFNYDQRFTIEDIIALPFSQDIVKLADGTETTVGDYKAQYKEGYTFEGWGFSPSNYSVVSYNYAMTANNLTFYAIWKPIKVELQYCTMDLSFAETDVQQNVVNNRLDLTTGGMTYVDSQEIIYVSETLNYKTEVTEIMPPSDMYNNFDFSGWYLDPKFTIPLKSDEQLYVRTGYFSLTKESNENILYDPLYFSGGQMPSIEDIEYVNGFSNKDEHNSFIKLFAKWIPREYTIKYHLNLPDADSYIDLSKMLPSVLSPNIVSNIIYEDDGETLRLNTKVYQGCYLYNTDGQVSVLYDKGNFTDCVFHINDVTGLPLYTLKGWNSYADGLGYDAQNASETYFNKANFRVEGNVITVYAQWQRYNRLNYYYYAGQNNKILLKTENIKSSQVLLNTMENLVDGIDPNTRVINFTEKQKEMNFISNKTYQVPNNSTFVGWKNSATDTIGQNPLYIAEQVYRVGTDVHSDQGLYVNDYVRDLYAAWITNTNYYTYDLGEPVDKVSFAEGAPIENELLNADGSYKIKKFDTTSNNYTLQTISSSKFMVTVDKGARTHSLMGWRLADGTIISGQTQEIIDFSAGAKYPFVKNTVLYSGQSHNIMTNVYFIGKVEINNDTYYTEYRAKEDADLGGRSYIWLKAKSVRLVTMTGVWVENSILTFDKGVGDAEWAVGYNASMLETKVGGSTQVTLPTVEGILSRPYYVFAGWSTVNREGSITIDYNEFIENNQIFEAGQGYNMFDHAEFQRDTTFYAVWKPIVYSISIYAKEHNSGTNSTLERVYIAKEKVVQDKVSATDNIILAGNSLVYYDVNNERQEKLLSAHAGTGYGLSGWTNKTGAELDKVDVYYEISILNGINLALLNPYPTSTGDYLVSVYPMFSILTFDVNIIRRGEGLTIDESVRIQNVEYGTKMYDLLLDQSIEVEASNFGEGYEFALWEIHGDVDNNGILKEDYLIDLSTSNRAVRSDINITLKARKKTYQVLVKLTNPQGIEVETVMWTLEHGSNLSDLNDELMAVVYGDKYNYVGYNFASWDISAMGVTTAGRENLNGIMVTSRYDLTTNYKAADIHINVEYYSENSSNADKIESIGYSKKYGEIFFISNAALSVTPLKNKHILKGWSLDLTKAQYYSDMESFTLTNNQISFREYESVDANNVKSYTLNFQAKWVEAKTLTFETAGVNITTSIPLQLEFEANSTVKFKDLLVSTLNHNQISQMNNLGRYKGVWVDQDGREFVVNVNNSTIIMDKDYVLTPKFEPVKYTITFRYYNNGTYSTLTSATMEASDDYITPPLLHSELTINSYLNAVPALKNYQALCYYLTEAAYASKDENMKLSLGAEFNFANNSSYLLTRNNDVFTFVIEVEKVATVFYYEDDLNAATVIASARVFNNSQYIIGASNQSTGVVDIIPEKTGYVFDGWTTRVNGPKTYNNGQTITYTGTFETLYPIWAARDITINYYSFTEDGDPEEKTAVVKFNASITFVDEPRNGYRTMGWAETNTGDKKYNIGQTVAVSELYKNYNNFEISVYAKYERLYNVYYDNGRGDSGATPLQTLIMGETITLLTYASTGLADVEGGVFENWTLNNNVITQLKLERREGNVVYYNNGYSYIASSANDFDIRLIATWDIATYSIQFITYDAAGNEVVQYGLIDASGNTTIGNAIELYEHNGTDTYTFTLPTSLDPYVKDGQKYAFNNKWTDGVTVITGTTVDVQLTKNHVFRPTYVPVFVFDFGVWESPSNPGVTDTVKFESKQGDTFAFSVMTDVVNVYNTANTDHKVVGFKDSDNNYYSMTATNNELSIINPTFSTETTYTQNKTFTPVYIYYVDLVIYKDYDYDNATFGTATNITNFIVGDTINLTDYSYVNANYNTVGYVITTANNYNYSSNPSVKYMGEIQITETMVGSLTGTKKTLYLYPVLQAKITLTINITNVVATTYVNIGDKYDLEYTYTATDNYLTVWSDSVNGAAYDANAIIKKPITFNANSKPYWSVQVNNNMSHIITNYLDVAILDKKSTETVSLPVSSDLTIVGNYQLQGWYISYGIDNYMMEGSNRKVYAAGASIVIDDILKALLGEGYDESSLTGTGYSLTMSPVWGYLVYSLTIDNSDANATYTHQVTNISNASYDADDFISTTYYVLNGSQITFNTVGSVKAMTITAYICSGGSVVLDSLYNPITATVKITPVITEGYVSNGWCNTTNPTEALNNFTMSGNVTLKTLTPAIASVTVNVVLKYNNVTLTADNYDEYKQYCYLSSGTGDDSYSKTFTGNYGTNIAFSVICGEGCEIKSSPGGQVISGVYWYTGILTYESELVIVVGKKEVFNSVINIVDTSNITGFDAALITSGSVKLSQTYNSSTETVGEANLLDLLTNSQAFTNNINNGADLQIETTINSAYYYVDTIIITVDGVATSYDTNDMVVNNRIHVVSGVPHITIVLKERTYSVSYENVSSATPVMQVNSTPVTSSIDISIPSFENYTGHTLVGVKILSGNNVASAVQVGYITNDTTISSNVLITTLTGISKLTKDTRIHLVPVYTTDTKTITITTEDDSKGYFIVQYDSTSYTTNEVSINVFYGATLGFTYQVANNVISENTLTIPVVDSTAISANGVVTETTKTYTIQFVPNGTYSFINGYKKADTTYLTNGETITSDMTLTTYVEVGTGLVLVTIADNSTTGYNNKNLPVIEIFHAKISESSAYYDAFMYDNDGALESVDNELAITSNERYGTIIKPIEGFYISSYDVVVNILEYDTTTQQFINTEIKLSDGVDLGSAYGILLGDYNTEFEISVFWDYVMYGVEIQLEVERIEYSATLQLEAATPGTTLDTLMNTYTAVELNSSAITTTPYQFGDYKLRKSNEYSININNACFEIESVYYVCDGTTYNLYNVDDSVILSNVITSFDLVNGKLTIVFGEHYKNIDIYIKLALKSTYEVLFHRNTIDDTLYHIYNYSGYAYNQALTITQGELYTPSAIEIDGTKYSFDKWTYYNGNYELDKRNNNLDSDKFEDFTTLVWTFNANTPNLHLFANWKKTFIVVFDSFPNDGLNEYSVVGGLNTTLYDVSVFDEINPWLLYDSSIHGIDTINYSGDQYYIPSRSILEGKFYTFEGFAFEYGGNYYEIKYVKSAIRGGTNKEICGFDLIKKNATVIWSANIHEDPNVDFYKYTFSLNEFFDSEDIQDTITIRPIWEYPQVSSAGMEADDENDILWLSYHNGIYMRDGSKDLFHSKRYGLSVEPGTIIYGGYERQAIIIKTISGQIYGAYIYQNHDIVLKYRIHSKLDGSSCHDVMYEIPVTEKMVWEDLVGVDECLDIHFTYPSVGYGYNYTINLNWDATQNSSVDYSITNISIHNVYDTGYLKVLGYKNSELLDEFDIRKDETVNLNIAYDKLVFIGLYYDDTGSYGSCSYSLGDFEIRFNNYYIDGDVSTTSLYVVDLKCADTGAYDEPMEFTYRLNIDAINADFASYLVDDLNSVSTTMGDFNIFYYKPIYESGSIIGYENIPTYIGVDAGMATISNIIPATRVYFNWSNDKYDLMQVLSGGVNILYRDLTNDLYYIELNDNRITDSQFKLVFDIKTSNVNFTINGKTYASAYLKGTNEFIPGTTQLADITPDSQLIAFANLITLGYKELYENYNTNSQYRAWLEELFDDVSALKGNMIYNVESKVLKSNGTSQEFYTERDFINMFYYPINQNIATYYYDVNEWKNIWFEGWNYDIYSPLTGATIDDLFVPLGSTSVSFNTIPSSDALILTFNMTTEALANGGIKIIELTGETYDYYVLGDSETDIIDGNSCYKSLRIKVKDGSKLPKFEFVGDKHSYIDQDTQDSLDNLTGKMFTLNSGQPNSIEVDGSKEYVFDIEFKVKKIKVDIVYLNESEQEMQTLISDGTLFTYNNSYENIVEHYAVENIVWDGKSYTITEVKTQYVNNSNHHTWNFDEKLKSYLETYADNDYKMENLTITIKLIYKVNA